jgi:hypothetical protein
MFCIAAFIVLAILGIFSARYRSLAKKAWVCTARKTTFRKCDTSFKEDTKSLLLGKIIITRPRLAKFLEKWLDVFAFVFVILTIWSLFIVLVSGLNLFVYGTCNPNNAESCAVGAEACGITTEKEGFWNSIGSGNVLSWTADEARQLGETITRIPDRMKNWDAKDFVTESSSYYMPEDANKPYALEVIDPGCVFCAELFKNIKEAGVDERYNLTYIAYPIPNTDNASGYNFTHSYHISRYLEAIKLHPIDVTPAADWQLLERIFTWNDDRGFPYQSQINSIYTDEQVDELLANWLRDIGYDEEQIDQIKETRDSDEVTQRLEEQKNIVDNQIKTVKIPTFIFEGKRFDGVVDTGRLE